METLPLYVREVGECWEWICSTNGTGYPQAYVGGSRPVLVQRYVLTELMGRKVPSRQYCVSTRCGNRTCVHPQHLLVRSRSAVLRDTYRTGRRMGPLEYARRINGAGSHMAKLTPEQVLEIRARPLEQTHVSIAAEYGVGAKCVSEIRRGLTWRQAVPSASVFAWRPAR